MNSPESFMEEQTRALEDAQRTHGTSQHRKVAEVLSVIALYHQHAVHDLDQALVYHHRALASLEGHRARLIAAEQEQEQQQQEQPQSEQQPEHDGGPEENGREREEDGDNSSISSSEDESRCENGGSSNNGCGGRSNNGGGAGARLVSPSSETPPLPPSEPRQQQQTPPRSDSRREEPPPPPENKDNKNGSSASTTKTSSNKKRRSPFLIEMAVTLTDIGNVLQTMNDAPGALSAYRRALALFEEGAADGSVSANHPSILSASRGIARLTRGSSA